MIGQFIKEEKGLFILMFLIFVYIVLALAISAYMEYYFFSSVNLFEYKDIFEKILKFFHSI